jgi:uncharacterized protein YidB (DUF937 family)
MSFLESMLGGVVGAEMTGVVSKLIAEHGGVAGLVSKFEQGGLGHIVQSWVGTGNNLPISPQQLQEILGNQNLAQLAQRFGLNPQELSQQLARLLPQAVDHLTPGGAIPKV